MRHSLQLYRLERSCLIHYRTANVLNLCLSGKRKTPLLLCTPTNLFWSRKKKDCDKPKKESDSSGTCSKESGNNVKEALNEYCDKTKNVKKNLDQKLKCAKEEYQMKLKELEHKYKCQTVELKKEYNFKICQAKEDFKNEKHGANEEYCNKVKPPKPKCDESPKLSCSDKLKDECEELKNVKENSAEPKAKNKNEDFKKVKKQLVQDPCNSRITEKNYDSDVPSRQVKQKKSEELSKKLKSDGDDEPKKLKDGCVQPIRTKKDATDEIAQKKTNKGRKEDAELSNECKKGNTEEFNTEKKEGKNKEADNSVVCSVERKGVSKDTMVTSKITGMEMPALIFGTYKLRDMKAAQLALKTAFSVGFRAIDTSISYGNDEILGCVLSYALDEAGLKREDIFIINKLPYDAMRCDLICETFEKSLDNLKTPYVDLFLINFPVGVTKDKHGDPKLDEKVDHICIWRCMESFVENDKAKHLGVANFNCEQLENLFDRSKIKPSNIQVEMHAYFQQKSLRKVAKSLGLSVTAYAPLGISPALMKLLKESCFKGLEFIPNFLEDSTIKDIAMKSCKEPGQILLRYLLQMDDQVGMVIGSSNPTTIAKNMNLFDFCLDEDDMISIKKLDQEKSGRLFNKNVFKIIFPGVESSPMFPWNS